jgi:hypothetical protein
MTKVEIDRFMFPIPPAHQPGLPSRDASYSFARPIVRRAAAWLTRASFPFNSSCCKSKARVRSLPLRGMVKAKILIKCHALQRML